MIWILHGQQTSDNVSVEADFEAAKLYANSEISRCEYKYKRGDVRLLRLNVKEPSKSTYNLNYLKPMVEAANKLSETVTIKFSPQMPAKISPELAVRFEYWLAPRIEAE